MITPRHAALVAEAAGRRRQPHAQEGQAHSQQGFPPCSRWRQSQRRLAVASPRDPAEDPAVAVVDGSELLRRAVEANNVPRRGLHRQIRRRADLLKSDVYYYAPDQRRQHVIMRPKPDVQAYLTGQSAPRQRRRRALCLPRFMTLTRDPNRARQ